MTHHFLVKSTDFVYWYYYVFQVNIHKKSDRFATFLFLQFWLNQELLQSVFVFQFSHVLPFLDVPVFFCSFFIFWSFSFITSMSFCNSSEVLFLLIITPFLPILQSRQETISTCFWFKNFLNLVVIKNISNSVIFV